MSEESTVKFAICFVLDENDISIQIGNLQNLENEDLERICLLLYSLNTGLLYQDIIGHLGSEAVNYPDSAEPILKLISALRKMGNQTSTTPSVLPSQVFGRMNGA